MIFCPRDGMALRHVSTSASLINEVVADRFLVQRELGKGGMGTVYLAQQIKIGRPCALKLLREQLATSPDAIMRFNREAANASRVSHPNVVQVYDFGEAEQGMIYLAMEYVDGESLSAILVREGPFPPRRATAILLQVADALGAAHDLGIVHRDLKPDNIMIARAKDGGDFVKVVDFGVSRVMEQDSQKVTATGLVIGTPDYMSPEQLVGGHIDARSDVFSLAVVAFRLFTAELPYTAQSIMQVLDARFGGPARRLHDVIPGVAWPAQLQQVLDAGMAVKPDDRYASAQAFAEDLERVMLGWTPDAADGAPWDMHLRRASGARSPGRESAITAAPLNATAIAADPSRSRDAGAGSSTAADGWIAPPGASAGVVQQAPASSNASTAATPRAMHMKKASWPRTLLYASAAVLLLGAAAATGWYLTQRSSSSEKAKAPAADGALVAQQNEKPSPLPNADSPAAKSQPPSVGGGGTPATQPTGKGDQNIAKNGGGGSVVSPPANTPVDHGATFARIRVLTDSAGSIEDAKEALRLLAKLDMPSLSREERAEAAYRRFESYVKLDPRRACTFLDSLVPLTRGTRFSEGTQLYVSTAGEACR